MNRIEKFEDIVALQKARVLTREIYKSSRVGEFAKDFGLKDQIQRASVSTMSNIAKVLSAVGIRVSSVSIHSKGSCGEVKSHLYVALDQGYVTQLGFDDLYGQASEVSGCSLAS